MAILLRNVLKDVFVTIQVKKNLPFATKKLLVILFLTLNGRGPAIAGLARWKIHHLHITSYLSLLVLLFAILPHFL